ncbi:MAG: hypothetical protein ABIJ59_00765 [Pseudomonadota bacterium]
MDFDRIFPLLILLLFFLLPSLLRQIKRAGKIPQKNTVFSKIGNQIRLFIKEIEAQRQQQQAGTPSSGIWETLAQEEDYLPAPDKEPEKDQDKEQWINESEFIKPVQEIKLPDNFNEIGKSKPAQIQAKIDKIDKTFKQAPCKTIGSYKSNQLQNAVIWSEILGKPVALREK